MHDHDHDFADEDAVCRARCEAHGYLDCALCRCGECGGREGEHAARCSEVWPATAPGYPGTSRVCRCEEDAGDNADCPLHGVWE